MPTLTAGQTATVELSAFGTLAISLVSNGRRSGSGSIAFASSAPDLRSDVQATTAQSKTYGPFGAPMTATVRCADGSLTYTVAGFDLSATELAATQALLTAYDNQPATWYNGEINSTVTPTITADGDLATATDQVPLKWLAVINADDDVAAAQQLMDEGPNVVTVLLGQQESPAVTDDDGAAEIITTIHAVCVSSSAVPADYTGGAYIISGSETDIADVLANMARFDFSSGLGATTARLIASPLYSTNFSQLSVQVGVLA